MYYIIGWIALILAFILQLLVGSYYSRIGEFLGSFMVFPIIVFLLMITLIIIYHALVSKPNKSIKEELIKEKAEKQTAPEMLSSDTDLYLSSNISNDIVNYWIKNQENVVVSEAKCILNGGVIDLIQLYLQKVDEALNQVVIKELNSDNYLVKEGELILGSIKVKQDSLYFYDTNNTAIYSCILDEVDKDEMDQAINSILNIASFFSVSTANEKTEIFFMKDREEELIGKYFFALHNLDLNTGSKNNIDKRIPLIFAIIIDIQIQLALKNIKK